MEEDLPYAREKGGVEVPLLPARPTSCLSQRHEWGKRLWPRHPLMSCSDAYLLEQFLGPLAAGAT